MSTGGYRIDFDEVKRTVTMEAVLGFLSLTGLKSKGAGQWKGACPFCKGVDCFVVSNSGGRDKTGAFNCFKCPAGGDQIELVSLARGFGRKDTKGVFAAAKELHDRFLARAGGGASNGSENASPQPQRAERKGFDPEAYAAGLDPAHEALAGLGLAPETLRSWRAGYAAAGVNRGRLALAVVGADGAVLGFVGRALKDETPALIFPNGLAADACIFGVDRVSAGPLTLVRDPVDVLKADEAGYGNVVCFLTAEISCAQLHALAALMIERGCETLSFF